MLFRSISFGWDCLLGKDRGFVVVGTTNISWTRRSIVGAVNDKSGVSLHDWYTEVSFQVSVYNPDEMFHLGQGHQHACAGRQFGWWVDVEALTVSVHSRSWR